MEPDKGTPTNVVPYSDNVIMHKFLAEGLANRRFHTKHAGDLQVYAVALEVLAVSHKVRCSRRECMSLFL